MTVCYCPRCDIPRQSIHSAAQHLWKSEDEDHEDVDDLDDAILVVMRDHVDEVEGADSPEPSAETTPDGPETTVEDGPSPSEAVETDGGGLGLGPSRATSPAPAEEDVVEEEPSAACPSCGDDLGDPSGFSPGKTYRCTECRSKFDGEEVS